MFVDPSGVEVVVVVDPEGRVVVVVVSGGVFVVVVSGGVVVVVVSGVLVVDAFVDPSGVVVVSFCEGHRSAPMLLSSSTVTCCSPSIAQ